MFNLIQGVQDETKKKIIEMLEKLAGTAGQAAEHLWAAACRAIFARGIAGVTGCVLGIVVAVVVWALINRKVTQLYPDDEDSRMMTFVVTTLVGLIACGFLISGIADNLSCIIAPEGEAIFKVLGK